MTLVPVSPTTDFQPFRIRSVTEHTAEVYVFADAKVGDQFSTRVTDVLSYSD